MDNLNIEQLNQSRESLLLEQNYLNSKLGILNKAIDGVGFILDYFRIVENRNVDILVVDKVVETFEKDIEIEYFENTPIKKEPKHPLDEVNENRKEVYKLIVKYNKSFTVKELQAFYKKENGTSSVKEENFIMNSINKFYLNGQLRRYKFDVSPYRYGLTEWFQSGTLIKEQYR